MRRSSFGSRRIHVVAPVGDGAPPRGRFGAQNQLAAHAADRRVRERGGERQQRVAREALARVREDQDVAGRPHDPGVQGDGLAGRRQLHELHSIAEGGECLRRCVGGAVGHDDDLATFGRIVERQQVVDARREPLRLVPRGNDDRQYGSANSGWSCHVAAARSVRCAAANRACPDEAGTPVLRGAAAKSGPDHQQQPIAHIDVGDEQCR